MTKQEVITLLPELKQMTASRDKTIYTIIISILFNLDLEVLKHITQ